MDSPHSLNHPRSLIIMADDFGIGPATSRGILDMAVAGRVTATVLLVNSPHAESAVREWRDAGELLPLGWHACLTLDRPLLRPDQVPSLIGPNGAFWPLGAFLRRLFAGQINPAEVGRELAAQHQRFIDLVREPPAFVNTHHHIHCFAPIGRAVRSVLAHQRPLPYLRRIRESWSMLWNVPGARIKRAVLSLLGRREARRQARDGFPGNDWLAGITDPESLQDPDFLIRQLRETPGQVVELTCHPGHLDLSLPGRDGTLENGLIHRRVRELELLSDERLPEAIRQAGFVLSAPAPLTSSEPRRFRHAA